MKKAQSQRGIWKNKPVSYSANIWKGMHFNWSVVMILTICTHLYSYSVYIFDIVTLSITSFVYWHRTVILIFWLFKNGLYMDWLISLLLLCLNKWEPALPKWVIKFPVATKWNQTKFGSYKWGPFVGDIKWVIMQLMTYVSMWTLGKFKL